MNLVEAVNKALGTNGTNLQGALNEAAGVDASNVTEAISKYEGGGGGIVIPEITVDWSDESMSKGTYTSTVPFDEMYTMVSNYVNACFPLVFPTGEATNYMALASAESVDDYRLLKVTIYDSSFQLWENGGISEAQK